MSSRHLGRHFKKVTGTTPLQWLHTQRIRHAQELLETTDDTVDAVATATGMGTATTLRRHFARTVGVPPDSYRRTFHAQPQPSTVRSPALQPDGPLPDQATGAGRQLRLDQSQSLRMIRRGTILVVEVVTAHVVDEAAALGDAHPAPDEVRRLVNEAPRLELLR